MAHSETKQHLADCVSEARKQAALLPRGKVRDALLAKAQQYEAQQRLSATAVEGGNSERGQETLCSSTR